MRRRVVKNQNLVETWREEYTRGGIPSSSREEPSGSVADFIKLLSGHGIRGGTAVDVGCGTGRNSLFMAHHGFQVVAIDFVPELVASLEERATEQGLATQVSAFCQNVTAPWPVPDGGADIVIDTFCYKHLISAEERAAYRSEIVRTTHSGSVYLITFADPADGYYGRLVPVERDEGTSVVVDPANRIPSRLYRLTDMEHEYSPYFNVVYSRQKQRPGAMHGMVYERVTNVLHMRRR